MLHKSALPPPGAAAAPPESRAGAAAAPDASADTGAVAGEATAPATKPRNHGTRRPRRLWLRCECDDFCEALAELGDPVLAAARIGLPVIEAFRTRDADPAFDAEWRRAIAIAWELVEFRLLGQLLQREPQGLPEAATASERREADKAVVQTQKLIFGLLEARMGAALAKPGPAPVARVHGKPVDSEAAVKLRDALHRIEELRKMKKAAELEAANNPNGLQPKVEGAGATGVPRKPSDRETGHDQPVPS
ncbi:MAG: hypothetical protein WCO82_12680 [Sphingomonadales bacterium]|jgi:hypothetical protein